jgi:flagellar hook-length control protein FliK
VAAAVAQLSQGSDAGSKTKNEGASTGDAQDVVGALGRTLAVAAEDPQTRGTAPASSPNAPAQPDLPPEARFADANHGNLVSSMRAQLMPNGGTMRIRLDPPQLGALQVTVHMRDGVMTAAFETSTDEATRLLSHSLAQLKGVLESQGLNVDKLQVQQAPRETQATGRNDNHQQEQSGGGHQQREASRQEQQEHQRREMMRRMWRRLSGAGGPLDVTG